MYMYAYICGSVCFPVCIGGVCEPKCPGMRRIDNGTLAEPQVCVSVCTHVCECIYAYLHAFLCECRSTICEQMVCEGQTMARYACVHVYVCVLVCMCVDVEHMRRIDNFTLAGPHMRVCMYMYVYLYVCV